MRKATARAGEVAYPVIRMNNAAVVQPGEGEFQSCLVENCTGNLYFVLPLKTETGVVICDSSVINVSFLRHLEEIYTVLLLLFFF